VSLTWEIDPDGNCLGGVCIPAHMTDLVDKAKKFYQEQFPGCHLSVEHGLTYTSITIYKEKPQ